MQNDYRQGFDLDSLAVQNHMVGNINPRTLANQLAPVAKDMAERGEMPFALLTMTQAVNQRMLSRQPAQITYPPTFYAFNASAMLRHKDF
jgi:hypothetical protein